MEKTGLSLQPAKTKILEINGQIGLLEYGKAKMCLTRAIKYLESWLSQIWGQTRKYKECAQILEEQYQE